MPPFSCNTIHGRMNGSFKNLDIVTCGIKTIGEVFIHFPPLKTAIHGLPFAPVLEIHA